jgi:GT2 family glycosyltransferase
LLALMPGITVVIPNWNGRHLLTSICLPSLAAQSFRNFSIVVVDNGSTDGSVLYLRSERPDVTVIEMKHNAGFAAAVNRGIAATDSEYMALVNNDVELHSAWLEEMVSTARRLPDAGSLASKILDFSDRTLITAAGDCVSRCAKVSSRGSGQRDHGQFDNVEQVFSACAGAALYRRTALQAVGLFDEDFFAYLEDVDWGFRAQLSGYTCSYVPSAIAYHVGGATTLSVTGLQSSLIARNTYWLVLKNFPWRLALRASPGIAFMIARRFFRVFRYGHRRQALAAVFKAACMTPAMLRKRRQIQSARRLSDHQVMSILSDDVSLRVQARAQLRTLLIRARSSTPASPG